MTDTPKASIANRLKLLPTIEVKPRAEGTRLRDSVDFEWVADLGDSIAVQGLQTPILVDPEGVLIAGEHRLEAFRRNARLKIPCKHSGYKNWTAIPTRTVQLSQDLSPTLVELTENLYRKKMHWKEEAKGFFELMKIIPQEEDETAEDYHQRFANYFGIAASRVTLYCHVESYMERPQVAAATSAREAYNVVSRLRKRELDVLSDDLANLMLGDINPSEGVSTPEPAPLRIAGVDEIPQDIKSPVKQLPESIQLHCADFIEFASNYSGPRFNFLHCDFPYGINYHKSSMTNAKAWDTYEDTPELYFDLIKALLVNKDRLLTKDSHVLFWYSEKYGDETRKLFAEAGFKRWQHPQVWHKSCNSGVLPDYRRYSRHTYETAMVFTLGDPHIVSPVADSYSGPAVKTQNHVSEKPEEMLRHFLRLFVDSSTRMLDPTAGSHNAIAVAHDLGARLAVGVEYNPVFYEAAKRRF